MDLDRYRSGWIELARREREALDKAKAHARSVLPAIVEALVQRGATRIWLIGSLASGAFTEHSDIDVMTEGLGANDVQRVASELSDRIDIHVDVLRAEDLRDGWRRYHERYGERLHG